MWEQHFHRGWKKFEELKIIASNNFKWGGMKKKVFRKYLLSASIRCLCCRLELCQIVPFPQVQMERWKNNILRGVSEEKDGRKRKSSLERALRAAKTTARIPNLQTKWRGHLHFDDTRNCSSITCPTKCERALHPPLAPSTLPARKSRAYTSAPSKAAPILMYQKNKSEYRTRVFKCSSISAWSTRRSLDGGKL